MQWQRISLCKPCLCKQIVYALFDVAKKVRFGFSGHQHQVVTLCHRGHNLGNRRFHLATKPVAMHGMSVFFADGKPHLRLRLVTFAVQQHKVFVRHALRVFVDVVVLIVFFKSVTRLQNIPLLMRKECDDPCFYVLQWFCDRLWFSFLREIRVLCFSVFFWVDRFFS